MKALLGTLLCLVLATSQSFAIKGGPPYPGGSISIQGAYAGILQPVFDPTDPFSTNSLGVFTLSVPRTGLATGTFIMFVRGQRFSGTIDGLGDTTKGAVQAILNGEFSIANTTTFSDIFGFTLTNTNATVKAVAQGKLDAKVVSSTSSTNQGATLLKGTAVLFITENVDTTATPTPTPSPGSSSGSSGGISASLAFTVAGFRQSTTAGG
jgi:hypothetical protein